MVKYEEALEITLELKGYVDYVCLTLKGEAFDTNKINKLQEYIGNQQSKIEKIERALEYEFIPTAYTKIKSILKDESK